jgi:hypothetical protein
MRLHENVVLDILVIRDDCSSGFIRLHPVVEQALCQLIPVEPRLLAWRKLFRLGCFGRGEVSHQRRETLVVSVCLAYTIIKIGRYTTDMGKLIVWTP